MGRIVCGLCVLACLATLAVEASGAVGFAGRSSAAAAYDPVALATDWLAAMGQPIPGTVTIVEVPTDSLGNGSLGRTTVGPDGTTIEIDVGKIEDVIASGGAMTADALVKGVATVIRHELKHTPELGGPPDGQLDFCTHMGARKEDMQFLCDEVLASMQEGPDKQALCWFHRMLTRDYNARLRTRNQQCPGPAETRVFPCC